MRPISPWQLFGRTLKASFDLTSRHAWLILIPFALDLWLWLGPRLSIEAVSRPLVEQWVTIVKEQGQENPLFAGEDVMNSVEETMTRFNLFVLLDTPLVGIPILLNTVSPAQTPLPTSKIAVESAEALISNYLWLTLAGVVLSATYFSLIAELVTSGQIDWQRWITRRFPYSFLFLFLYGLLMLILFFVITLFFSLFYALSPFLGAILLFFLLLGGMWVVLLCSFVIQAIAFNGVGPFRAIAASMVIVRNYFPYAFVFVIISYLLTQLVTMVGLAADSGTWLTVVNLAGHAFVTTAICVAFFLFYRDRTLEIEKRRQNPPSTPSH